MVKEHVVVVGNGPAGNQAALTLREKDTDLRVTLLSKDRKSCYRPHLLPEMIAGKMEEDRLYMSSTEFYKERGIKLRNRQKVVDINIHNNEVILDHKEVLHYDGLILAVGGQPRIPERLRIFENFLYTLKTLQDAKHWIHKLSQVDSVLMIGGDLTSLAVTRALLHLNKKVYFVLNEEAFWPLRCNQRLLGEVSTRLKGRGVHVLESVQIKGIAHTSEETFRVQVGEANVETGMIGAFYGLVPDIRFLARSGLKIDRGILVDEYLCAGVEGVYATGDCAQIYHPEIRDYWVSIGHDNAMHLGRIAALNLLGGKIHTRAPVESIFDMQGIKVNTSWWTEF